MRIKEVCERTGLTDRAVRLYIDNGLVAPKQECNYMGRRSFVFSEEDIRILEAVATLRRADFSIADIIKMQLSPECLPDVVACHRKKLEEEITTKKNILFSLESYDDHSQKNYFDLATAISSSASRISIPKEDSGMNLKDIKQIIKKRLSVLVSLIILLFSLFSIASKVIKIVFARMIISQSGGYSMEYRWDISSINEHMVIFFSVIALAAGVIPLVVYLAGGKRYWLIVSISFCLLAAVLLAIMPSADAGNFYRYEYLTYSGLFKNVIGKSNVIPFIIKLIKYVPIAISCVVSGIGFFRHKPYEEE